MHCDQCDDVVIVQRCTTVEFGQNKHSSSIQVFFMPQKKRCDEKNLTVCGLFNYVLKCFCHVMYLLQLMSQYPSLYSTPAHSDSGKWDALVKASESLLKEKELIIER